VLVEAMACGLPVVTTTAGGITELVRHEVNGLLVASGDLAAIADALCRLLTDAGSRSRLGTAARRTVELGYDTDDAARRLEGVLVSRIPADLEPAR
jgi:glycosyltransferase involved in cell wall biosynthesis